MNFQLAALALSTLPLLGLSACLGEDSTTAPETVFQSSYQPVKREYWITTELIQKWDMVPTGVAPMTNETIYPERRYLHQPIRYRLTDSNWNLLPMPDWQQLSGPIIRATVGDSVIVHFRNGDAVDMRLSIHPHNLLYDAANEGIWRADMPAEWPMVGTAGGAIHPGDEFTYRWVATEKSVGVGPYHSHSFKPAEEIARGLIGLIIVDQPPDHPEYIKYDTTVALIFKTYQALVDGNDSTPTTDACTYPLIPWNGGCHPREHVPEAQWPENIVDTAARGGGPEVHTINGIAYANLPGLSFKQGQRVRLAIVAMNDEGSQNHTAHFHGEMLQEVSRQNLYKDVFDLPSAVALELMMKADNLGKWMLHCHVEHHASEMMAMYEIFKDSAATHP